MNVNNEVLRALLLKFGEVHQNKQGSHQVQSMRFCMFCGRELSSFTKSGRVQTHIGHYHVVYKGKTFDFCMNKYRCQKRW